MLKLAFLFLLLIPTQLRAQPQTVTLAAAKSLEEALLELKPQVEAALPTVKIALTTGASGALAEQILQGAPIDLFLSAGKAPMDKVEREGLAQNRQVFLHNELRFIAHQKSDIKNLHDLTDPKVKRIALGEPRLVPAGEYALAALTHLKITDALKPKLIYAKDVRQVLAYIDRNEADAGFVYKSDLKKDRPINRNIKDLGGMPQDSHPSIAYELALIRKRKNPNSEKVQAFLLSQGAAKVWTEHGFQIPKPKGIKASATN